MKVWLATVVMVSLIAIAPRSAPGAAPPPSSVTIAPCSGVGPLPVPYSLAALTQAWGPPSTLVGGAVAYLNYGMALAFNGDVINMVAVFGDAEPYITDRGVKLGDSLSRVQSIYGGPTRTAPFTPFWGGNYTGTVRTYVFPQCDASLGFVANADGKVTVIVLTRPVSKAAAPTQTSAPPAPAAVAVPPASTTSPSAAPSTPPTPTALPGNDIGTSPWPTTCLQPHPNDACLMIVNRAGKPVDVTVQTVYYHACGNSLTICPGPIDVGSLVEGRIVGTDPTQGTVARPIRLPADGMLLLRLPKSVGQQTGPQPYYFTASEPNEPSVWWLKAGNFPGEGQLIDGPFSSSSDCEAAAPMNTDSHCEEQPGRAGRQSTGQLTVAGGENKQWVVSL